MILFENKKYKIIEKPLITHGGSKTGGFTMYINKETGSKIVEMTKQAGLFSLEKLEGL